MNRPTSTNSMFHKKPFIVIWESTRSCDLACKHCRADAQPDPDPNELNNEEARTLIKNIADSFGPVLFVITGGDPLKRADLFELISYGRSLGLRMAITPSATPLLTSEAINKLQKAGIARMAISIDGANAKDHDALRGFSGTYDRSIAALEHAHKIGLETQINTSISKANAVDIPRLADMAQYLATTLWSVFFIVPTGRAEKNIILDAVGHEKAYRQLAQIATNSNYTFDIKTTAGQPYYRVLRQEYTRLGIDPKSHYGRAPGSVNDGKGFVFISHTGSVQPSGFLPIDCGNIRESSIADIYCDHDLFVSLRHADYLEGKCSYCEYNTICAGSRSRSFALTGNPLASDPTCLYQPKGKVGQVRVGQQSLSQKKRPLQTQLK